MLRSLEGLAALSWVSNVAVEKAEAILIPDFLPWNFGLQSLAQAPGLSGGTWARLGFLQWAPWCSLESPQSLGPTLALALGDGHLCVSEVSGFFYLDWNCWADHSIFMPFASSHPSFHLPSAFGGTFPVFSSNSQSEIQSLPYSPALSSLSDLGLGLLFLRTIQLWLYRLISYL